jgi:dihydroorotase
MKEMASAGAIGFSDDGDPVMPDKAMLRALEISCDTGLPVIDHCEDTNLTVGGVMNEGKISAALGLKGMPSTAEDIITARDVRLAEKAGGHLHIAHVSTAESVDIIRAAKDMGVPVTAEVTPHHLTLTDDKIDGTDTSFKVNPPLRTERDVKALIEALDEGVIDVIATDHAPHTIAEKQRGFDKAPFGISGFETAFGVLMSLVHGGKISLSTLVSKLTCEPAAIIGSRGTDIGTLSVGKPADITIFHPGREWTVDTGKFASKGKTSPYNGVKLKGKIMATICGGNLTYIEESIRIKVNR